MAKAQTHFDDFIFLMFLVCFLFCFVFLRLQYLFFYRSEQCFLYAQTHIEFIAFQSSVIHGAMSILLSCVCVSFEFHFDQKRSEFKQEEEEQNRSVWARLQSISLCGMTRF